MVVQPQKRPHALLNPDDQTMSHFLDRLTHFTPPLERTTAFQRITNYSAVDSRYTNAVTNDARFFNCPAF